MAKLPRLRGFMMPSRLGIMDNHDYRTLKLLEEIEKDNNLSQRGVAKKLDISLGLANSFIKRLAGKGYFKIMSIPKNRVRYILTPEGFAEKTRLTYRYIQSSYKYYKDARVKFRILLQALTTNGVKNVVLYGAGELAEIAYISFKETSLNITGVVDDTVNVAVSSVTSKYFFKVAVIKKLSRTKGILTSLLFSTILFGSNSCKEVCAPSLELSSLLSFSYFEYFIVKVFVAYSLLKEVLNVSSGAIKNLPIKTSL